MKKVFILFLLPFLGFAQSTLITAGGTGNVNLPNLTYSQITAIASPQRGMQAFDTDYGCIRVYNGTSWRCHDTPENDPNVTITAIKSDNTGISNIFSTYNDIFPNNSTIVAGTFSGTTTFGTTTLTSAGGQDIFLVKYDQNGAVSWAYRMGGAGNGSNLFGDELISDVMVEPSTQNFYIVGSVASATVTGVTAASGATIPTAVGGTDGFIAKFDVNGQLLWSSTFNGTGTFSFDGFNTMSVFGSEVYVGGYQTGGTNLGGFNITAPRFVAKYNSLGVVQWVYETSGIIKDLASNFNRVLITGNFNSTILLGASTYTSVGGADAFVACLDNSGNFVWGDTFGSVNGDNGNSVAINNGKALVAGNYSATMSWGNNTLSIFSGIENFLVQYDMSGNKEWIKAIKGTSFSDNITAIRTDALNNIYLLGIMNNKLWIDRKIITQWNSLLCIFVAKLSPTADCIWAKTFTSNTIQPFGISSSIIMSGVSKINISGYFSGVNIKFGHSTLTTNGNNMFVATFIEN
ncbi:MAG: hypothetical protein ACOVO2_11640 [Emticicia sp.]|uniref:hypothetical protein n=1 Tax=Emticicia sp. TaxID=1930953 RepID=UPI003BA41008